MAVAAAQLLPHLPSAADLLRRADAVPALVSAFLTEHAQNDLDLMAGDDLPEIVVGGKKHAQQAKACQLKILRDRALSSANLHGSAEQHLTISINTSE